MAQTDPFSSPELGRFVGGMIPSPHDPRDFLYQSRSPVTAATAFRNHDLRDYHGQSLAMVTRDQQRVGSCTAFAWSALRAAATARYHIDQGDSPDVRAPSARFLYHLERSEMMDPPTYPQDSGADMRSGGLVLSKYGCALEEYCPYTGTADDPAPSQEAYDSAAWYGISTFYRIAGTGQALINGTLQCLEEQWPFVIAVLVTEAFEQARSDGRMAMPAKNAPILGGHAVCVFANFIDNSFPGGGAWLAQNQWGSGWADGGWCLIPFAYATQTTQYGPLLQEAWTCR